MQCDAFTKVSTHAGAQNITLDTNRSINGLICPSAIHFRCIAEGTTFLEWQRNGDPIQHFTLDCSSDSIREVRVNNFTVRLTSSSCMPINSLKSTLVANLSVLYSGDRITCAGFNISETITVSSSEILGTIISLAATHNVVTIFHTHTQTQLLLQLPSSLKPSPP